jgi:hypothetical protein
VVHGEDGSLLYCAYQKHRVNECMQENQLSLMSSDRIPHDSKVGSRAMSNSVIDQSFTTTKADFGLNEADASTKCHVEESSHVKAAEHRHYRKNPRTANNKTRKQRSSRSPGRRNRRKAGLGKQ